MRHAVYAQKLSRFQPLQNGVQRGFRNVYRRLQILDYLITVGIPFDEYAQNQSVQHSPLQLIIHAIPPNTQYYTTHSIVLSTVFYLF